MGLVLSGPVQGLVQYTMGIVLSGPVQGLVHNGPGTQRTGKGTGTRQDWYTTGLVHS